MTSSNVISITDWNDMRQVQAEITRWAEATFPGRTDHAALSKAVLEEIPELLQHKKEHGTASIGEELADVFILFMDLASIWGVDLPTAIRHKMDKNYRRMWLRDPATGIAQHVAARPRVRQLGPINWALLKCPLCLLVGHAHPITHEESANSQALWDHNAFCSACQRPFDSSIPF